MARRLLIFVLASVLLALVSSEAFARGGGKGVCKGKRDLGFAHAEAFVGVLAIPSLAVNGDGTPRRLIGVASPSSTEPMLGAGLGFEIRCDYLVFNLTGVRYAGPFAGATAGTTTADDTRVNVSRGALQTVTFTLPSFGLPTGVQIFPNPDTKVTFGVDYGLEYLWGSALVSGAGASPTASSIASLDFYLRAQAAVCLKLGATIPKTTMGWGCVTLSAVVYDRQPFPGGAVGFRVDL